MPVIETQTTNTAEQGGPDPAIASAVEQMEVAVAKLHGVKLTDSSARPQGYAKDEASLTANYISMKEAQAKAQAAIEGNEPKGDSTVDETVEQSNAETSPGAVADESQATETEEVGESADKTDVPLAKEAPKEYGKKVKKTIDKLTAQKKTLEEQQAQKDKSIQELQERLEKLEMERTEASTQAAIVTPEEEKSWGDYAKEYDVNKLQDDVRKLSEARDEINDAIDIGAVSTDENGNEYLMEVNGKRFTKTQLVAIRRDLNRKINEVIPSRIRTVSENSKVKGIADNYIKEWVPEALDNKSEVYAEIQSFKNSRHGWILRDVPQAELYMALGAREAARMLRESGQLVKAPAAIAQVKAFKPTPRANVQTSAGPAIVGASDKSELMTEYKKLIQYAASTKREVDQLKALAFKRENNL